MKQLIKRTPLYKRNQVVDVQGRKMKYIKMVSGNYVFRSYPGNVLYTLNKAGFLIPN